MCCIWARLTARKNAWRTSIEVVDEGVAASRTLSLFPENHCEGLLQKFSAQCEAGGTRRRVPA
jgi:hypothetical protein